MAVRISVEEYLPSQEIPRERREYELAKSVARLLKISLTEAQLLSGELPFVLPVPHEQTDATSLIEQFRTIGVRAETHQIPPGNPVHCSSHPAFLEAKICDVCQASLCIVCVRQNSGLCSSCTNKKVSSKKWQTRRLLVLLLGLFATLIYAWSELRQRRVEWDRPQRIAIVIVEAEQTVPPGVIARFRDVGEEVEAKLQFEFQRYSEWKHRPFEFEVIGPVVEPTPPPRLEGDDLLSLLRFNLALASYADVLDEASRLDDSNYDVRVYMRTRFWEKRTEVVEGLGQQGGQLGVVDAAISAPGAPFAWFAVVHEVLHTRGANDKYGDDGRALVPQGLAAPHQSPLYPQPGIELMARGQPLSATEEAPPGPVQLWTIGKWTAKEIGWTSASRHPPSPR